MQTNSGSNEFHGSGFFYYCGLGPLTPGSCAAAGGTLGAALKGFSATVPSLQRRNYPRFPIDLAWFGNDASSNYNALQIKVEKRFSHGLQFLAHNTYSHANTFDSTYYSVNPKVAYGPDPFSRNSVFVVNAVYLLPIGKGQRFLGNASRALDLVVGGWQVSQTLNWSSGLPWTPSIGECGSITDAGPCRANFLSGQSVNVGPRQVNGQWYEFVPLPAISYNLTTAQIGTDSCALARPTSGPLALPACGTLGNARFNSFTGPSGFSSDFSLTKNFTITERVTAQFRFDACNIFNHPILGFNSNQGNTCLDCGGSAGKITDIQADASPGSPNGMRQLQFGARVVF